MIQGEPYPLGASVYADRVNLSAVMNTKEECGIVLYDKRDRKKKERIPFSKEARRGNICYGAIHNLETEQYVYRFYIGKEEVTDPYARELIGREKQFACFHSAEYEWGGDKPLHLPYEHSIFYLLHVKGFTRHKTSLTAHPGTFQGIVEKIPYLKQLGVTTLELMPAYEFEEKEVPEQEERGFPDYMKQRYVDMKEMQAADKKTEKRINFWGYKKGYYFAPKSAYAATEHPVMELKDMIKALHENGMEVIMQFYFPVSVKQGFMVEVLKYWILEYHIDGIHVKGERVPVTLLATDPLFGNCKILCQDMPLSEIYEEKEQPVYRNLAYYQDDFMYDMRRFLKGDDGMVPAVMNAIRRNPPKAAVINFITNYYGFSLRDLVSYDHKHNEANGEANRDGTEYNASWNCGAEGKNRKKSVELLRQKQMKNAMVLVLLSQGTPLLRAGDEFGHTQKGNNNAYCQDNEISWLDWEGNQELLDFTKQLIAFRKSSPLFGRENEYQMTDVQSCGYPEISFHGEEAWKPQSDNYDHLLGVLYCGFQMGKADGRESMKAEEFLYVAYNCHWQKHFFALPKLPKGMKWRTVLTTDGQEGLIGEEKKQSACLNGRTIGIYVGRKEKLK